MTHYRQIIVNIAVDDNAPEQELEDVLSDISDVADKEYDKHECIKDIRARLN
jgi:hypothetical protein